MSKGTKYKVLKDDYKCKYYLVNTTDIDKAQEIILRHYKERHFKSMQVECIVEAGASPSMIDWKVPYRGTIVKVNLEK